MPDDRKLLYLVDTLSLVFQNFHGIPNMTGPKGQPTNAVFGFTRDLRSLLKDKKPSHLVLCLEGGKSDRKEAFADYKATRKEAPADLEQQVPLVIEMAEAHGVPCISVPGQEADDVMATLAARGERDGFDVRVVTTDKDARQLISERVKLYNCRSGNEMGVPELADEWGVTPDRVTDFQGLVGDTSDNIPGVPKVGPKAATELLTRFGDLEGVLEAAASEAGIEKSRVLNKTVRANLADPAHQKNARLSKDLATLRTDLDTGMTWEDAKVSEPDHDRLLTLFTDLGFKRLSEEARDNSSDRPTAVVGAGGYVRRKRGQPETGPTLNAITVDTPEAFDDFLDELREQPAFCVDLETTDLDATRAEIVGWAVCWENWRAFYIPVQTPEGTPSLDAGAVLDAMRPILADPSKRVHNQNLKYDLTVLLGAGGDVATVGTDPMVADYLLAAGERSHSLDALARRHLDRRTTPITDLIGQGKEQRMMFEVDVAEVTTYAAEDADVAWQLAALMEGKLREEHLWELYEDVERPLIPVLARMEHTGIRLDPAELERQSAEITARLDELEAEIKHLAGDEEFNVRSTKQLREVLFEKLKLPVVKRTKTGPSTDAEVLEKLAPKHPLPALVQEHRGLNKLQGTYVDALPKLVHPETGRIHCNFNQVVTATGRLSSSDPNLQNIPARTPEGRRVRKAFVPGEDGWVLLAADYSQVELRFLAHYSQDEALLNAFREDRDVHAAVAAQIFGVDLADVTKAQRGIAKTTNFGVIYGQSSYGLSAKLGIPQDEAQAFIDAYLKTYPGVRALIEKTLSNVRNSGYAYTILGRRREVTGIRPKYFGQMNLPERTAFNTVIQGSAADLIKLAMIAVTDRLKAEDHPARLLLQIHDELLFEVPSDRADDLEALVTEEMTGAMEIDVPLKVDVGTGDNWLDVK